VEKSILKRQLKDASPPRYWLLDTLRQYGQAWLRELGGQATMQERHFDLRACEVGGSLGCPAS
jgi:predicted ATPase